MKPLNPTEIIIAGLQRKEANAEAQQQSEADQAAVPLQEVKNEIAHAVVLLISFLDGYKGTTSVDNFSEFPKSIKTPDSATIVSAIKALEQSLKPTNYNDKKVVTALAEVKRAVSANVPPSTVSIKNATEIANSLATTLAPYLKAIQSLELKPEITVEPTPVTVQPVDLEPIMERFDALEKATKKVSDTLLKLRFPTTNVPTDPLIKYAPADIDDAGSVQYFGFTDVGGAWYIRRFDTSTAPKTLRFAFGQSNYAAAWTVRASQTYAIWGT